ncbi:DUF4391 domain-containing protein [Methylomonas paludis]|uniref:DUF4391 domain-containing protein n=1 Tax=Methylomonas paludis TaxID=1173101 RepID=A0A975MRC8_9GAMM|nr:DUF4391 domain-containing protein [Methylomonas paludis]QWF72099.1 DUF4391 domain-containing protein [Methylomonas paludis]
MTQALFSYPKQALFGRVLPKNKIYQHTATNSTLKALFVQQIEQIIWQYKLAPETINLPAKPGVAEIQIFDISLKTPELNEAVLRCIDQAIPFPIIYQLHYAERIKVMAAYKRPSTTDSHKWLVDAYLASNWLAQDLIRQPLPAVLDLALLYEHLLRQLIPLPPRHGEDIQQHLQRWTELQTKQAECQKLQNRLHKEQQFNRKVELNAQLRTLQTELKRLQN